MKIAVIRQKYVNYGGAESFVFQYTDCMARKGHEIHIFAHQWAPRKDDRIRVHSVPAWKINAFIRTLSFAWFANRAVARERFDIVQSHERTFWQDVFRAGDGCHKRWLEIRSRSYSPLKRGLMWLNPFHRLILALERRMFEGKGARKIIAISQMVKKDIEDLYRVPQGKVVVVYNGVDLERFHPGKKETVGKAVRERLGIPPGDRVILHVGSGFERKGTRYLLESLSGLESENWRLVLMGRGNWGKYLQPLPSRERSRIIPLAPVDNIEDYYAAADLFVLPSLYEPFGNANLEALAAGLPIVTSRYCGAAEIVSPKVDGMVIEDPTCSEEIAACINFALKEENRGTLSLGARELAETFTQTRNAEAMLKVYEDLLGR
ncbi:MAG: hypothetical protein COV67_06835 [Nitrospinae bacterium CG11_big_fil_rev_8_21_14_0_20_56_8]|nr:MAG: hypothetical protein COV67_06835 [Nitrospinae bacterium CG11_big_fil_rev_8_21_14_0_20_56_8]